MVVIKPYLIIDAISALALLTIGGLVILKNRRILLNRLFFYFIFFLSGWILANYFSNDLSLPLALATVANHMVLFFFAMALIFLLKFVIVISRNRFLTQHNRTASYFSYIAATLSLTPFVVNGIVRQEQVYAIKFGILAPIYFISLALNVIAIIAALIIGIRKNSGEDKRKVITILASIGVVLVVNLVTNALLPLATGSFGLTNIGPLTTIILAAGLSYTIVKHRLFDIRLVIARSIGYLLSVLTLGLIYGLVNFFILNRFILKGADISTPNELIFTVSAVFLAFTFQPLKMFFARITRQIFYQDAYDPQLFLDQLNKVLVSTLELEILLRQSSNIIKNNLKSEFCTFSINKTSSTGRHIVGQDKHSFSDEKAIFSHKHTPFAVSNIIVTDELEENYTHLRRTYQQNNIALVALLKDTANKKDDGIGTLVIGPKKSGNPYNSQDIRIIEIIINELVIAIQNALRFEEIQAFNATLQQKINDATRRLSHANEKLKALDESKDEFISMASHQLRTPLTSVKGYLSMVLEGDAGKLNDNQHKLLDQAFISSQRMVYLIADLLNVSRLRTGKFVIELVTTNLADVVEGEIGQLIETAKGRNLKLAYNKPKNFPLLNLDETKIRQVIMNFTDNAIYYTPAGGHINVELEDKGSTIEFRVVDDGLGVPKHEQHHLFTKFYRAGNARKARPDGTGLGLFMAKKVIVAQGGSIIFHSELGEGSTFGFTFAKSKLSLPPS